MPCTVLTQCPCGLAAALRLFPTNHFDGSANVGTGKGIPGWPR